VVVTPPAQAAAAGAQAAASAQSTTQVFFEGGNGFVTSSLTGQTQEIGAGQNAIVDNLGKVSQPVVTPPEQRNVMFQTWTSAQTIGSYSTAEGGAGVATNTSQQPLPQAPGGTIQGQAGADVLQPLANEIQNFMNIISTLTYDQLFQQPLVLNIYNQTIPFESAYGYGYGTIVMDCFQLVILPDQTWAGVTSGTWSGEIPTSWWASFTDPVTGNHLSFDVTGEGDVWSGTISGDIYTTTPHIAIDGEIAGIATETAPNQGTFEGGAVGTWEPEPDGPG
jgi:hypothetical protein